MAATGRQSNGRPPWTASQFRRRWSGLARSCGRWQRRHRRRTCAAARPGPAGRTSNCYSTWCSDTWSSGALLPLVRLFGRLPDRAGRVFAGLLNAGRRPFHVVNYLGSCGGALVFHGPRLIRQMDRTVAALSGQLPTSPSTPPSPPRTSASGIAGSRVRRWRATVSALTSRGWCVRAGTSARWRSRSASGDRSPTYGPPCDQH